jgi:hypothetical protein
LKKRTKKLLLLKEALNCPGETVGGPQLVKVFCFFFSKKKVFLAFPGLHVSASRSKIIHAICK